MLIERNSDIRAVQNLLDQFPVVSILGARQCGKTTLAKGMPFTHYFDLENPRDAAKLENPQLALEGLDGLIVIDEIQRAPDLFPLIRYLVDGNSSQKYLILGSASKALIRQSSDSLAGRIGYHHLGGFGIEDVWDASLKTLWIRGGFPRSYLAPSEEKSLTWREQYIGTFLENDIPQLGIQIPVQTLRRFWTMVSHFHGQMVNFSELGRSFGLSDVTIRRYIDILEGTFMLRVLQPWHANIGKRTVKRPKLYIRDSGLFHTLLSIESADDLLSHPKLGASWEGFAMECVSRNLKGPVYFWGTHTGAEVDLFWQKGGKNWGLEFKYMDAPRITRSMASALDDLALEHLWVVYPGNQEYKVHDKITVLPLKKSGKIAGLEE